MANITLGGTPVETIGELPDIGSKAPDFKLTGVDLTDVYLDDFAGESVVLNIFPSVDTDVCAQSVRTFNQKASALKNTKVLCISKDLPFAMKRFCGSEGLEDVVSLSDYKTGAFGTDYGVAFTTGPFESMLSRCIVVIDANDQVIYTEQVNEISDEPNYEAALDALKNA